MAFFTAVTDEDLARARRDPAFRQQLLQSNLTALIAELNRRKGKERTLPRPEAAALREGAQLAVRLADIIGRLEQQIRR